MKKRIANVKLGRRIRRELGDLSSLKASMERLGLLHPIVVTPDSRLVAGRRRLETAKRLGWKTIEATVIEIEPEDLQAAELDENEERKDLTMSEKVEVYQARLEAERRDAAKRKGGRPKKGEKKTGGKVPPVKKSRDLAAAGLGESYRTLERAAEVVEAAVEDPERYAPLVEKLDETENVSAVHRDLRVERHSDKAKREGRELFEVSGGDGHVQDLDSIAGKIRCFYADPNWGYDDSTSRGSARSSYETEHADSIASRLSEIVKRLAHPDGAHLWLWTTWPKIRDQHPHRLLDALGFAWSSELVWTKPRMATGRWLRKQTEVCVLATRGKAPRLTKGLSDILDVSASVDFDAPRQHSRKPVEMYELIESFSAGPYLELYARSVGPREGWLYHGDEAETDAGGNHGA